MSKRRYLSMIGVIIVLGALAACASSPQATPTQIPAEPLPTSTAGLLPTPAPAEPEVTAAVALPPATSVPLPSNEAPVGGMPAADASPIEVQAVGFQAEDGQNLTGRYFPPADSPAPLVVLMHWAPGDQNDWMAVTNWLQGRRVPPAAMGDPSWRDASWFPPPPDGLSVGVFTFNFRGCDGSCRSFDRDGWLLDARAAMQKAHQLEGIDPDRIVVIGASIGADGAADGCSWLNSQYPDSCLGALSLSPGGYLTVPYADAVNALGAEPAPKAAWCLYAEGDGESKRSCEQALGENYQAIQYPGSDHGMMLIRPKLEPDPLQVILDFLQQTLEE